jgi:putative copper export protein
VWRSRRKPPPEPVGALRPGLAGRSGGGGDDPSTVGALRPSLRPRSADGASPDGASPDEASPDEATEGAEGSPPAESLARPPASREGWLWQAPLVLLGTAVVATGAAVARGTGGIAAAPAVVASVRGASYAGLVLVAGCLAFTAVVWPEGLRARRLASTVWVGWLTVLLATVAQLLLRDGSGTPLPDGGRVVMALGVRIGVLLAGVVWVSAALRGRTAPRIAGLALALVLAGTWVYAGPAAPSWLTVVVTLAHISAACVWAGGLVVLAVVLLPGESIAALERPLSSLSRLATVCVAVLALSGVLHGWSRAGSLGDLFTTGYGHAFWLKVAAVTAMLLVANGNRQYVLRHVENRAPATGAPPPLHILGLFLGAELAFGVVVMVLTGILVGAPVDG